MNIEKNNLGGQVDSIIEKADEDDIHLAGIDMSKVSVTDKDIYMQMADIRRKVEAPGSDIITFQDRIDDLIKVTKKTAVNAANENEKNFVGLVANKLQNLSLILQREIYKRKKNAK